MKRWIHASNKPLSRLDPWEVEKLGYKLVDTGYAYNKEDFDKIKKDLTSEYTDCKVYRVATDTPGAIMWEAYAKKEPIESSTDATTRGRKALEQFKRKYPKAYEVLGQ